MAKPLTVLICHRAIFEWTTVYHASFLMLKDAVTQAPILHYPDPVKRYIVCIDAYDDACGAQLSEET